MENGSTWGTWIAYVAIVAFLLFLLFLVTRTMLLFSTLTYMPLNRIFRRIERLFKREPK